MSDPDIEMSDAGDIPGWEDDIAAEIINQALEREILDYRDPKKGKKRKARGPGKRMVEKVVNSPRVSERLEKVIRYMKMAKFPSVGSFLYALYCDRNKRHVNRCGRFFKQGGFKKIICMWFDDARVKGSAENQQVIMEVVDSLIQKEIRLLERRKELYKRAKDFEPISLGTFEFDCVHDIYERQCPLLLSMILKLTQGGAVGGGGGGVEGDDDTGGAEDNAERLRGGCSRKRGRMLATTTAISCLLYGRSFRMNFWQAMIGFFLHGHNTHRDAMETLHHLGLCALYSYVIGAEKAHAKESVMRLKERVKREPFMISWDNINRKIQVAHELLHNKAHMINWTTVAIIFLRSPESVSLPATPDLSAAWVNEVSRRSMTAMDFMLPQESREYHWPMCRGMLGGIIDKYFGHPARLQRVVSRLVDGVETTKVVSWAPELVDPVRLLSEQRSDVHPLKTLELNEGTIEGTALVMDAILEELDLGGVEDDLRGRILCSGDQLSTKLLQTARFLRNKERPGKNLDWAVAVIGLFHLQMSILHLIMRHHLGHEDGRDPASLYKFRNLLKRTGIGEKISNFRAAEELVEHVFIGHVLAMFMECFRAETVNQLGEKLEEVDIEVEIERAYHRFFRVGLVHEARMLSGFDQSGSKPKGKRMDPGGDEVDEELPDAESPDLMACKEKCDVVLENAVLFMQHVALYEELKSAIHVGDPGRITRVLDYFTIMFQASSLHNYAIELLELSASVRYEWTSELRDVYLENSLVNLSGRAGGFMEVDRFLEHIVRTISDQWNPNGNFSSARYLREVISVNAMATKNMKEQVRYSASGRQSRRTRKTAKERGDVVIVAKEISHERIFHFTEGRWMGAGREYQQAVDLLAMGTVALLEGKSVQRWKERSEVRLGCGFSAATPSSSNDSTDDLMEEEDWDFDLNDDDEFE